MSSPSSTLFPGVVHNQASRASWGRQFNLVNLWSSPRHQPVGLPFLTSRRQRLKQQEKLLNLQMPITKNFQIQQGFTRCCQAMQSILVLVSLARKYSELAGSCKAGSLGTILQGYSKLTRSYQTIMGQRVHARANNISHGTQVIHSSAQYSKSVITAVCQKSIT